MENYNIKIDIKKMKDVAFAKIKGRPCVIIPTDVNPELYVGAKGIYLNLVAFSLRTPSQFGDTHLVKSSPDKAAVDAMSEDERKAIPILGNMRPMKAAQMDAMTINDSDVDGDLPEA